MRVAWHTHGSGSGFRNTPPEAGALEPQPSALASQGAARKKTIRKFALNGF
jgi:hypothetical protein